MPFAQLLTAGAELAFNKLIAQQTDADVAYRALHGKRFILFIEPLPKAVTLVFSDSLSILHAPETLEQARQDLDASTCIISSHISVLDQLRETSQITSLVQSEDLTLIGDIRIAQQVSDLMKKLNIDPEEWLAQNTSDIFAHSTFSLASKALEKSKRAFNLVLQQSAEVMLDEKPIAARSQSVTSFKRAVSVLRDDVARFESKLNRFERISKKMSKK